MKRNFLLLIFCCFITNVFSQEKTEFGISTDGSWFMPQRENESRGWETKNGFGAGIGVYASRTLFWKISADAGLGYRYKEMQQHYSVYTGAEDPVTGFPLSLEGWDKLPMHYIVVPVHIQMLLGESFFIRGGIESTWLTNYGAVNEKPEFNWTVGLGSQKHKLKWSLNYIRGFKNQGFGPKTLGPEGYYKGSINRNNMLQLSFSYPIGHLKF